VAALNIHMMNKKPSDVTKAASGAQKPSIPVERDAEHKEPLLLTSVLVRNLYQPGELQDQGYY